MSAKLILPSGTTGFTNDRGQWICTGSQMGRRNILPEDPAKPVKLRIQRMNLIDGDYDTGGAYWGGPSPTSGRMYCAFRYRPSMVSIMLNFDALVFVRANSRAQAKQIVRRELPAAKFFH